MLEVSDDSGLLALVVPATYETFVARDWSQEQLLRHFQAQMKRHALLIWATGLEGRWKVAIKRGTTDAEGFREATGRLHVAGGSVLLTNYESLTMAAQFKDIRLPEEHQANFLV